MMKRGADWILIILLCCLIYQASCKSSYPIWERTLTGNSTVNSYLMRNPAAGADKIGLQTVKDIMEVIHAKQHIAKEECKSRRLLVIQMSSTSFEGTGSILKQVMLGVAIAMHSNRTLIWGLGHPFMFEHSKERWAGPEFDRLQINEQILNCSQPDPGAGPFGCFFEPVSTCSLGDVSPAELVEFSQNAYNESARVMLTEIRKGVALYHPPHGLMDYISRRRKYSGTLKKSIKERQHHLWAASVAAYAFRLKPSVESIFEEKMHQVFDSSIEEKQRNIVQHHQQSRCWGLHVRHGDLKALSNVYTYKEIFEFEDYFTVTRSLSNVLQQSPPCLFISTDSVEADKLQEIFNQFNEKEIAEQKKQLLTNQFDNEVPIKDQHFSGDALNPQRYKRIVYASDSFYNDLSGEDTNVDEEEADASSFLQWRSVNGQDAASSSQELEGYDQGTLRFINDQGEYELIEDEGDDDDDDDSDWEAFNNNKVNRELLDSLMLQSAHDRGDHISWYQHQIPTVRTIRNSDRYRTKHGSHTVAANGGCLRDPNYDQRGMRCALNYEDIILYQGIEEHRSVPRSVRLMRVLLESIEDLYLLSNCERLVAQGSSHFSTLAGLLIWARSGVSEIDHVNVYLDTPSITAGFTPTAYLHGMNLLNGTHGVDTRNPAAGRQRWLMHTNSFITALKTTAIDNSYLYPDDDYLDVANAMRLEQGLPRMPEKIFYWESRTWLGRANGSSYSYEPKWPGHCPSDATLEGIKQKKDLVNFASVAINLGVDHLGVSHTGQALQCWRTALHAIEKIPKKKRDKKVEEILSVARDNARTQWIMRYAEMALNENHDTAEYISYNAKYMQKTFDGVSYNRDAAGGLIDSMPQGDNFGGDGRMNLDQVQEEINRLEEKLTKLKQMRDRMLELSKEYAAVRQ